MEYIIKKQFCQVPESNQEQMMVKKIKLLLLTAVISLIAGAVLLFFFRENTDVSLLREEVQLPGNCVTVRSDVTGSAAPVNVYHKAPENVFGKDSVVMDENIPVSIDNSVSVGGGDNHSFMQVQYLPFKGAYLQPAANSVKGVALGYYMPQGEINGLSLAMVHLYNHKKSGVSLSLLDVSNMSNGLSLFFAGGAVDNRGCLVGVFNITENNNGVQIGLYNQAERNSLVEYPMKPENKEKKFGVQAGMINFSDSPGIQFGLWNTNPNSWIKHFPLINICF